MEGGSVFNDNVSGSLDEAGGHVGIGIQGEGGGGTAAEGGVFHAQGGVDRRQDVVAGLDGQLAVVHQITVAEMGAVYIRLALENQVSSADRQIGIRAGAAQDLGACAGNIQCSGPQRSIIRPSLSSFEPKLQPCIGIYRMNSLTSVGASKSS